MPTIKFYINKSDYRKITKDIEQIGVTMDCIFKENTDLVNPTVIMKVPPDTRIDTQTNYAYIDTTERYYYVEDVTYSQGRIFVKLKCDVLMSFQQAILAQNVIAKRSSSLYNIYQEDEKFKVYNYTVQRHIDFPSGFNANVQNFLLTVVGKTSSTLS